MVSTWWRPVTQNCHFNWETDDQNQTWYEGIIKLDITRLHVLTVQVNTKHTTATLLALMSFTTAPVQKQPVGACGSLGGVVGRGSHGFAKKIFRKICPN